MALAHRQGYGARDGDPDAGCRWVPADATGLRLRRCGPEDAPSVRGMACEEDGRRGADLRSLRSMQWCNPSGPRSLARLVEAGMIELVSESTDVFLDLLLGRGRTWLHDSLAGRQAGVSNGQKISRLRAGELDPDASAPPERA